MRIKITRANGDVIEADGEGCERALERCLSGSVTIQFNSPVVTQTSAELGRSIGETLAKDRRS